MDSKHLTSEEILKLPKDEFIEYMDRCTTSFYQNLTSIEDESYNRYSQREKVGYWCETLNSQMRQQTESGLDPYMIFNREWYLAMKRLEPDFDNMMDQVFDRFAYFKWIWKKEEYLKKIE